MALACHRWWPKDHPFGGCVDPHNPLRCTCGRGVRPPYAQGVRPYESVVVVRAFLMGCAFLLLVVGCAGTTRSEAPQRRARDTPKPPKSKHAPPKQRPQKKPDARGRG